MPDANGQRNEALAQAVAESGKHPSDIVNGITTERTLERWISGAVTPRDPFKTARIAKRLGKPRGELFG